MKSRILYLSCLFICTFLLSCSSSKVRTNKTSNSNFSSVKVYKNNVQATYYGDKFNGRKTANGTRFSNNELTAAHRTLPFGTLVRVTNLANKQSVIVVINDRGPIKLSREIDLTKKAFMTITDNKNHGILTVKMEIPK